MEVHFTVTVVDVKRAFRRLLARLPDEDEAGGDSIVFIAHGDTLEIVAGETSESLRASVAQPGLGIIPHSVFRGLARTLRFYRRRAIAVLFSPGTLRVDRTDLRHPSIAVPAAEQKDLFVARNLQNSVFRVFSG